MDLFFGNSPLSNQPLAEKLRPQKLSDVIGQEKAVATLRNLLQKDRMHSVLLWGPPGTGKTTLAEALAKESSAEFVRFNAVSAGVKELRSTGEEAAKLRRAYGKTTLVFVDEIHRFSRSQQDVLLPYVEKAEFVLIGATTETPTYYINRALLSRCRLIVLEPLSRDNLRSVLLRAHSLLKKNVASELTEEAIDYLISSADGDARQLIALIEEVLQTDKSAESPRTLEEVKSINERKFLPHDASGDMHYDLISALIKSVRGSDPDAAVYYLARLLKGGEDPRFISRRMMILASEDVGNADPRALPLAVSTHQACEILGHPEIRIPLAQLVIYLATAPKSNRSYLAINQAMDLVEKTGLQPVPKSLRSGQSQLLKDLGYGKDYQYSHDSPKGFIAQDFLPENLKGTGFYKPSARGHELQIRKYLDWIKGEPEDK